MIALLVFFVVLGITQIDNIFKLTQQTVICCASDFTSIDCKFETCISSGFVEANGGFTYLRELGFEFWSYLFIISFLILPMLILTYTELLQDS